MTDQKKIDEARKLFEEQEIAQGRSVEMTSCGEYLDGVVFFGWLNELDRIDAEYAQVQKAAEQCETMQRPKSECGCPDCGSSLIDWPKAEPVEPAPAQDEREAFEQHYHRFDLSRDPVSGAYFDSEVRCLWDAWQARATRPAQTEQQPVGVVDRLSVVAGKTTAYFDGRVCPIGTKLYAAPIAQTAPQPDCEWCAGAGKDHFGEKCEHCQAAPQHPDDAAVDRFAVAMKVKLAAARAKGRGGWENKDLVGDDRLAEMLVEHLCKGNAGTFEDVANFSMMLHQRGADPKVLAEAAPQPEQSGLVEALEKISRIAGDSINYHPSHMSRIAREALAAYRAALSAQGGGQ